MKLLTHTKTALLLLLIAGYAAPASAAQHSQQIVLHTSSVRFHPGDDPHYAAPEFNDSEWKKVQVPFMWNTGKERTGWFRLTFTRKQPVQLYSAALDFGNISGDAEVYINGAPASPAIGEHQLSGTKHFYRIPASACRMGDNIIAIRISAKQGIRAGIESSDLRGGSYTRLMRAYYASEIAGLSLIALYFFTGIFFILFLRFTRREMPFHIFGFYCLACALFYAGQSDVLLRHSGSPETLSLASKVFLCISFPLLLSFITEVYKMKHGLIHKISYVSAAASVFLSIVMPNAGMSALIVKLVAYPSWALPSIAVLSIFAKQSRQSKGARMLLIVTSFSILTVIGKICANEHLLPHSLYGAAEFAAAYGFAFFFFGLSFIIFNMIFKMSADLQIKSYSLQLAVKEREAAFRSIDFAYTEALSLLAVIAEIRDSETGSHIRRVSHFTKLLAEKKGLPKEEIERIFLAAPMHDVGKVGVPDRILLKKGSLTEEEFSLMKRHTVTGGRIFAGAKSPVLLKAAEIAMTHHEKYCGGGYPGNLTGEDIPLSGRIMALADIYDALRSRRPYKDELPHEKVVEIILKGDGRTAPKDFDPDLLQIFSTCHHQFNEIYLLNKD